MPQPSNFHKARAGAHFVAAELHRRGANDVSVSDADRAFHVFATSGSGEMTVRVKTKTVGDWQTSTKLGTAGGADPSSARFWALVDLGEESSARPAYFIVPEGWILNYIHEEIESHLASHGGSRPRNPGSTHCAIHPADVEQWRDRWDLLAL